MHTPTTHTITTFAIALSIPSRQHGTTHSSTMAFETLVKALQSLIFQQLTTKHQDIQQAVLNGALVWILPIRNLPLNSRPMTTTMPMIGVTMMFRLVRWITLARWMSWMPDNNNKSGGPSSAFQPTPSMQHIGSFVYTSKQTTIQPFGNEEIMDSIFAPTQSTSATSNAAAAGYNDMFATLLPLPDQDGYDMTIRRT